MTTGLYPQEFIITFKEPIECRQLRFVTSNGMFTYMKFFFVLGYIIQLFFFLLVKRFLMSSTSNQEPKNFETVFEKSTNRIFLMLIVIFFLCLALPNNENNLQITDHTLDRSLEVRHFKCVILAGYDSFASVHSLKFDGGNTRMGKKY
jgi:hypothetical protein